ncbi:MAG: hypothetical protein M1815_000020 [Lichina confinis]|nr:MAG: hypothetical protein M1815_000020 [Lichina confinis]
MDCEIEAARASFLGEDGAIEEVASPGSLQEMSVRSKIADVRQSSTENLTPRIGADTIADRREDVSRDKDDDRRELAVTAGQLLDSVRHDRSQKFQKSSFLHLMQQIRDGQATVEGTDIVQDVKPPDRARSGSFEAWINIPVAVNRSASTTIDASDMLNVESRYGINVERSARSLPLIETPAPGTSPSSHSAALTDSILGRSLVGGEIPSDNISPPSSSSPPPSEFSFSSASPSARPPPFSSLYFSPVEAKTGTASSEVEEEEPSGFGAGDEGPAPPFEERPSSVGHAVTDAKAALPLDNKGASSNKNVDDSEPPPPYTEGSSPLEAFTYLMAAAGGPTSLITQVQQGGPPINTLGDVGTDENIILDLRGTRFMLSRDELLTLPEFVLLSLFPNGLLPDGHVNAYGDGDVYPVDYDPASLQYMLDFFRQVAQTIPSRSPSPSAAHDLEAIAAEPVSGSATDMLQDRAGIIVLREDLDFYVIPPKAEIELAEMMEVKRAAGRALLDQAGIFSGLRKSEEAGTTEQHLIEMLTAGGFNHDDRWGHRAGEPNKAVICSLALARLRTDVHKSAEELTNGNSSSSNNSNVGASEINAGVTSTTSLIPGSPPGPSPGSPAPSSAAALGMAQKLLLFWRKPARRCWWEGTDLENVDGVDGTLKVWIRRVWTLEMVSVIPWASEYRDDEISLHSFRDDNDAFSP